MSAQAQDLLGAWYLQRWSFLYDDGRPSEHPLGPDALGLLLYTPTGQVSATLMRADRTRSFAYAGRYAVRDGAVFHTIEMATDPALIGVTSTRHIELMGDRLTLSGPDFHAGSGRTQKIEWVRR